jgi:hypothetical protein
MRPASNAQKHGRLADATFDFASSLRALRITEDTPHNLAICAG